MANMLSQGNSPGKFRRPQRQGFLPDRSRGGYDLPPGADYDWSTDPSNHIPGPYDVMPMRPSGSSGVPNIPYRPGYGFPPEPDSSFFDRHMFPPAMNPEDPWAYQPQKRLTDDFPYDFGNAGGTLNCSVDPANHPTETNRKVGVVPGSPSLAATVCNVSTINQANLAPGSNLPAGLTKVVLVQSSGGSPWPNRNGRPYEVWTWPGTRTTSPALDYKKGVRVMPMNAPFPYTQMKPQPTGSAQPGYLVPYGSRAMTVVLHPDKPPEKIPDDVHLHVPPGENEKEEKPLDKTGRSVKEVWGALTEVDDALDCMEKSFKKNPDPRHLKHVPINHRLDLRLYRLIREANAGNIDWQAFVNCMAVNNFQDKIIGRLGGGAARQLNRSPYAPRGRAYRGFGTGGFSTRMR